MSDDIGWHHPVDTSDQWDGFNDPGINTFSGSPIQSLAREAIQNALDARDSGIVDVKIRLHTVEAGTIPNLDELKANLKFCYEASIKESKKAKIFFDTAISALNNKKVQVLEISDYNTKGMEGPSENGTPFYAFMKAKGQSRKESDSATGSFGIGKFAPYATSKIRTIFVSTVYQDKSGTFKQLTQGKSILMSHDVGEERKLGVGFWGVRNKCRPIEGVSSGLPAWLLRANNEGELSSCKGSKVTILSFDTSKNWQEHLAVSVAENFFGAISDGRLSVEIDKKYTLNQKKISGFLSRADLRELIEKLKNEPEQFDNSKYYLTALQDKVEVKIEESEMRDLGFCQLRILIGEGLPKKVCVLRNGMFITDSLSRLKSFSDFKDFVAVFHCQNSKGNELLRAMEPPRHNDFEPDRLSTNEEKKKGARALLEIAKWIREKLKKHAKDPVSEVTEIDELKDFFADEGADGSGTGIEEINPFGEVVIRAKPIKLKVPSARKSGSGAEVGEGEGSDGDGGADGSGGGGGDGEGGSGGGTGGAGGGSNQSPIDVNNVRSVPTGKRTRKVAFTSGSSGKISLRLMEAGADSDYNVSIIKSNKGAVNNGGVDLDVTSGSRVNLDIELDQDFTGAVKVVVNEI